MKTINIQTAVRQIAEGQTSSNDQPFFLIVGAGVSCPQVPLASKIVKDLRGSARVLIPSAADPMDEYSQVLEAVKPNPEQRRRYFEELIVGKRIPTACLSIAYLLYEKKFDTLITPNFDDFVTRALRLFDTTPLVYDRRESLQLVNWENKRTQLVHVHGTYRDYDILNLKGEIRENKGITSQLTALLRNRSPVVLGYAGWPGDVIMAALRSRLQPNKLRYNLYWFCHTAASAERLPPWLKNHPNVFFIIPSGNQQGESLDASKVTRLLLDAFGLSQVPPLATDPLKSFRVSLPQDPEAGEWCNLFVFSQRMRGFYPNRDALSRVFHPVQVMANARPGSCITSAGRTLRGWASCYQEIAWFARERNLSFEFLLSDESTVKDLEEGQQAEVRRDRGQALARFMELQRILGDKCKVWETAHLIIDGLTIAEIGRSFIGDESDDTSVSPHKLICQFDINAAQGPNKPTLVLACTCGITSGQRDPYCTVHGLLSRTHQLIKGSRALSESAGSQAELVASLQEQGLAVRRNAPEKYVPHLRGVFDSIKDPKKAVPPPVCIQTNVWAGCDTFCRMCDHWKDSESNLPLDSWKKIFENLAKIGIRTLVVSGGEPLARPDIDRLLHYIRDLRKHFGGSYEAPLLRVGLLTSGLIEGDVERHQKVCAAIRECVDWVSVSIDGTESIDRRIRNPRDSFLPRARCLEQFCASIRGADSLRLAATVTLQKENVESGDIKKMTAGLRDTCEFIKSLGIENVNFKLATGGKDSLAKAPAFLVDQKTVELFFKSLCFEAIANEKGNNLDYLRRCFAGRVFDASDVSNGTPIKSYYTNHPMRCFSPFVFSVIDASGKVYPCCHLYRDNHGNDPRSAEYRKTHCLGNLAPDFDFLRVWHGGDYSREREMLKKIDPNNPDFLPCGECTRHVQVNYTLNSFQRVFEHDPDDFDRWCKRQMEDPDKDLLGNSSSLVWF